MRYSLPHNESTALPDDQLRKRIAAGEPLEHSHTLEEQIGGQLLAGFEIISLYEDHWDDQPPVPIHAGLHRHSCPQTVRVAAHS